MILQEIGEVKKAVAHMLPNIGAAISVDFLNRVAQKIRDLTFSCNNLRYKVTTLEAELELLSGQSRSVPRRLRKQAEGRAQMQAETAQDLYGYLDA